MQLLGTGQGSHIKKKKNEYEGNETIIITFFFFLNAIYKAETVLKLLKRNENDCSCASFIKHVQT